MKSKTPLSFFLLAIAALFIDGCTPPCSNIPTTQSPQLRIVNAMPDEPDIEIRIGKIGAPKVVSQDYPFELPASFGYSSSYADGTSLRSGFKQELLVLSKNGTVLLKDTAFDLTDHRHTLVIIGKASAAGTTSDARPRRLLYDDEMDKPDVHHSNVRYIDAIPDIKTIDVYYRSDNVHLPADLTMHYGDSLGYNRLDSATGLTVTEGGHPEKIIFTVPYGIGVPGIFASAILRGERFPLGADPSISIQLISDILPGRSIIPLKSFYVRLCNSMRIQKLNLLVQGVLDWTKPTGPRDNVPGQAALLSIASDSISDYAPFNPTYHGTASWYFGSGPPHDTTWIYTFARTFAANTRYTICALNKDKLNSGPQIPDSFILQDTMSSTPAGISRVRFVNLSPDHAVTFTIGTQNAALNQRDVVYLDVPSRHYDLDVKDAGSGNLLETIHFDAPDGLPTGVIFMSATDSDPLPYRVSPE